MNRRDYQAAFDLCAYGCCRHMRDKKRGRRIVKRRQRAAWKREVR